MWEGPRPLRRLWKDRDPSPGGTTRSNHLPFGSWNMASRPKDAETKTSLTTGWSRAQALQYTGQRAGDRGPGPQVTRMTWICITSHGTGASRCASRSAQCARPHLPIAGIIYHIHGEEQERPRLLGDGHVARRAETLIIQLSDPADSTNYDTALDRRARVPRACPSGAQEAASSRKACTTGAPSPGSA